MLSYATINLLNWNFKYKYYIHYSNYLLRGNAMNKKLVGKIIVLALVVIMLGTYIKQQLDDSKVVQSTGYEVDLSDEIGVKKGQFAPDFTLQTLDGKTVKLSEYKGKKVVINFWATWCSPCRTEMPAMQKYYEKRAQKDNVEILALNLTYDDKDADNVQTFVDSYKLSFPILLQETDALIKQYQVLQIPSTFFIDTEGRVQTHLAGTLNEEKLIHYTQQLN